MKKLNMALKYKMFAKILIFTIFGILSLRLVNSTDQGSPQTIHNVSNEGLDSSFSDINAQINKARNQIMIDGVVYNLVSQNKSHIQEEEAGYKNMDSSEILLALVNVSIAVFSAGLMSGLTVGYLSIDEWSLQINLNKEYSEKEVETKNKYLEIHSVLKDRHWLLVTLLLCNATAMEALPIFLNRLVNELQAIIISVTAVLIFGEIIPQAFCCGPNQIDIAFIMSKPTKVLMYITSPFSYPIARLLDFVIGEHKNKLFNSDELKVLVQLHTAEAVNKIIGVNLNIEQADDHEIEGIEGNLAKFIQNVIDIKNIPITKRFTPIDRVIYIDYETPITHEIVNHYISKGVSRIPVIRNNNKNDMIGYIRTVDFLKVDLKSNQSIKDRVCEIYTPIVAEPNANCYELFKLFKGGNHLAFITQQKDSLQKKISFYNPDLTLSKFMAKVGIGLDNRNDDIKIIGIVTLEDILESIIGEDISDESETRNQQNKRKIMKNFKNKINHVVNDIVAKSLRKTMTMKSENPLYSSLAYRDTDYDYENGPAYTLIREKNNL